MQWVPLPDYRQITSGDNPEKKLVFAIPKTATRPPASCTNKVTTSLLSDDTSAPGYTFKVQEPAGWWDQAVILMQDNLFGYDAAGDPIVSTFNKAFNQGFDIKTSQFKGNPFEFTTEMIGNLIAQSTETGSTHASYQNLAQEIIQSISVFNSTLGQYVTKYYPMGSTTDSWFRFFTDSWTHWMGNEGLYHSGFKYTPSAAENSTDYEYDDDAFPVKVRYFISTSVVVPSGTAADIEQESLNFSDSPLIKSTYPQTVFKITCKQLYGGATATNENLEFDAISTPERGIDLTPSVVA